MTAHLGELLLRRLRAGELDGGAGAQAEAHARGCAECGAKLRSIDEEQRRFEREIGFERFSAGVLRAARSQQKAREPVARWAYPALAVAALVTLVVAAEPLVDLYAPPDRPVNRVKGGAGLDLVVAAAGGGPQRIAARDAPEPILPGERLKLIFRPDGHRYAIAVTLDADGVVGRLHPEHGDSVALEGATERVELPAFELTGTGAERIVLVLSDEPLRYDDVRVAAERAYAAAGGDVTRLGALGVGGEELHRTVLK